MANSTQKQVNGLEMFWSMIPFIALIAMRGSALGGGLGGLGFGINSWVFRTTLPTVWKYVITGLVSIAVILLYIALRIIIDRATKQL